MSTPVPTAGFDMEGFTDVTNGGSWHIDVLAAPGIPEMLRTGGERELSLR